MVVVLTLTVKHYSRRNSAVSMVKRLVPISFIGVSSGVILWNKAL
jgi:hypothetical protein